MSCRVWLFRADARCDACFAHDACECATCVVVRCLHCSHAYTLQMHAHCLHGILMPLGLVMFVTNHQERFHCILAIGCRFSRCVTVTTKAPVTACPHASPARACSMGSCPYPTIGITAHGALLYVVTVIQTGQPATSNMRHHNDTPFRKCL